MMAEPQEMSVAEAIVRSLLDQGIDTIFGIGGTHTLQLLGAIERAKVMRFVPARTELGAAYMAIGHARATRRPAVVLTSTGPGALNVVAALEDAAWSCTPLLHLTTSIGGADFAGAVHETPDQQAILALASKALVRLDFSDVGGCVAASAFQARAMPAGPVTLDVPAGHWDDVVRLGPAPPPASPSGEADEPDLGRILDDLERARRPIVFVGGGAMAGDRGAAALDLAERIGAPIITSYQARTIAFPHHPLYVGPWATEPAVQAMAATADVALVFGSKLSALGTSGWQLPLPEATHRIESHRGQHPRYGHVRTVRGDAATVARSLGAATESRPTWFDVPALRREVRTAKRRSHPEELAFLDALAAAPDQARHLTADMSKAGFWTMKFVEAPQHAVHLFSSYLAMGTALPMAIGLAVATGEPVVSVLGDGALQMSSSELATMASLGLPVRLLVVVDHAYGILRDNCAAVGGSESLGVDLWNPDLVALGHAYGMEVTETPDVDSLAARLRTEIKGPELVLVEQGFTREW